MFVLIVSQAEFSQYGGRGKKVWTLTAVAMVLDSEERHQRAISARCSEVATIDGR
jgi:hypothetical protein